MFGRASAIKVKKFRRLTVSNLDSVKDIEEILKSPHGQALRLLNLFRLFIAAVFLFFGSHLGLGGSAQSLFIGISYLFFSVCLH